MPQRPPPPHDATELLARAEALAGHRLGDLAVWLDLDVPADLRRHKGWVGQLLELALGAESGSLAEPDFPQLGIELKSLPVDAQGRPRESTYVCTAPLEAVTRGAWEESWLARKLARVLWVPVEAEAALPLAERRIGTPLLWSPDAEEATLLRRDWEELTERICHGELAAITARFGEVLQIRPKAAHSRVLTRTVNSEGELEWVNPRGFYLRPHFTGAILRRHFDLPTA